MEKLSIKKCPSAETSLSKLLVKDNGLLGHSIFHSQPLALTFSLKRSIDSFPTSNGIEKCLNSRTLAEFSNQSETVEPESCHDNDSSSSTFSSFTAQTASLDQSGVSLLIPTDSNPNASAYETLCSPHKFSETKTSQQHSLDDSLQSSSSSNGLPRLLQKLSISDETQFCTSQPLKKCVYDCLKNTSNNSFRKPINENENLCVAQDIPYGTKNYTMQVLKKRLAVLSKEQLLEMAAYGMFYSQCVYDVGEALLNSDPASRRVMVRGLNYATTNLDFCRYFSQFGQLENAAIIRHPDGRSQGYGFLIYKDRYAAEEVINQRHYLDERLVSAKLAADQYTEFSRTLSKNGNILDNTTVERKKLFIRNINTKITEEILRKEFLVYGPIEECAIIRTSDKLSRSYGFVTFQNAGDALRAAQIPFRIIDGWVIFVAFSTGKVRRNRFDEKATIDPDVAATPQISYNYEALTNSDSFSGSYCKSHSSLVPQDLQANNAHCESIFSVHNSLIEDFSPFSMLSLSNLQQEDLTFRSSSWDQRSDAITLNSDPAITSFCSGSQFLPENKPRSLQLP